MLLILSISVCKGCLLASISGCTCSIRCFMVEAGLVQSISGFEGGGTESNVVLLGVLGVHSRSVNDVGCSTLSMQGVGIIIIYIVAYIRKFTILNSRYVPFLA